jgi:ribosomal protein S18 acetylase RimI-like enzyme
MSAVASARANNSTVRVATRADAEAVATMLARAFHDDPLICHFVADVASRPEKFKRIFKLLFKLAVGYGSCHVTDGFEAASLWRPPGQWHLPFWQSITNGPELLSVFGSDAFRVIATMDRIEKVHPKANHWYLQVVGTDPAKQGKGFGSLVLRHQLAIADAQNIPCYLESSKDTNIPIYQALGFELRGEIRIPDGPTLYPMWRNVGTRKS